MRVSVSRTKTAPLPAARRDQRVRPRRSQVCLTPKRAKNARRLGICLRCLTVSPNLKLLEDYAVGIQESQWREQEWPLGRALGQVGQVQRWRGFRVGQHG